MIKKLFALFLAFAIVEAPAATISGGGSVPSALSVSTITTSGAGTINDVRIGSTSSRTIDTVSGNPLIIAQILDVAGSGIVRLGAAQDVVYLRDAANVFALRNGTSGQIARVYRSYTDASNYSRAYVDVTGTTLNIGVEGAGTGASTLTGTTLTGNLKVTGNIASTPTNGGAVATSGTISTANTTVIRVSPSAAVTGVILQAGTIDGQQVTIANESAAANSVTFAAAATSNVSDGTSSVIAGLAARSFVWISNSSRWFPVK